MNTLLRLVPALVFVPALARAKEPPPLPVGPPSKAVTTDILDAIAEEMNRDMQELALPGAPKPYHIAYKVTEVDVNDVSATLGSVTSRRNRHFVNIEARVRVGSPQFDNTNFVVPQADEYDGVVGTNLPLEATPRMARRAAWQVTDAAYKEALIQLQAKIASRRAGGASRPADVPSLSPLNGQAPTPKPDPKNPKAKPEPAPGPNIIVNEEPVLVPINETLDELETRAKTLSALFRDNQVIRDSRVSVTSYLERRWYITTEGTSVTDTRRASGVLMVASGRADDGQALTQYFLRYGHTARDLPTDDELQAEAKNLGQTIVALAKAPIMERYSGPVLFEAEGAVGIARTTLAPHLGGTPVPEGLSPQDVKTFGGALTDKVGLKPLSSLLSIIDDPSTKTGGGKALIGGYRIDDEGVPAQKIEVAKDGTLKTLLTSRTPSHKGQQSNGHARRTGDGGSFHGSATNLFLIGKGGISRKALEQKLVTTAKAEGHKYGLIIKRFDDAAITSAPDFSKRELVQMIKSTDLALPPPTILAYRAYPDGKQELVRGVQLSEVPMRAWKDVIGVSTELTTYNFLVAAESQLSLRLTGGTDDGFVPSAGIESSIVTPDLLFKEIDVTAINADRPTPVVAKPK